jgi:hypothetical protein
LAHVPNQAHPIPSTDLVLVIIIIVLIVVVILHVAITTGHLCRDRTVLKLDCLESRAHDGGLTDLRQFTLARHGTLVAPGHDSRTRALLHRRHTDTNHHDDGQAALQRLGAEAHLLSQYLVDVVVTLVGDGFAHVHGKVLLHRKRYGSR